MERSDSGERQAPGGIRRRWLAPVLTAVALVLVVSACGSGGDDTAGGEGDGADTGATTSSVPPEPGGKLVFGITGETDGWNPTASRWGPSAYNVGRAIYDPLAVIDEEGVARPYLLEAMEPNEDFTEWTLTLREDVTFHNGDPLTPEIVAEHLKRIQEAPLSSSAFEPIDAVGVVREAADIQLENGEITEEEHALLSRQVVVFISQPWSTLPAFLAGLQTAYVPHPDFIAGEVEDPIGTGPFEFVEWVRDDHLTVERYSEYWREGMPYLDEVEFRPIVDPSTRANALQAGDIDLFHSNSAEHVLEAGPDGEGVEGFQVVFDGSAGDEQMLVLNTQTGPTTDLEVRRALALATDKQRLVEGLYQGFFEVADAPYPPESQWYTDPGWPEPDPEEATRLVEEWEAENGDLQIEFLVISSQENLRLAQAIEQQWEDVGIDVEINSTTENEFANQMLLGGFEVLMSQFFNGSDPDEHYQFWDPNPDRIGAPGELSLNFPRYTSDTMQEALNTARETDDTEQRIEEYAKVWKDWAENFPYIFLYHGQWILEANEDIRNLDTFTFPNGEPASPMQWGAVFLTDVWLDQS